MLDFRLPSRQDFSHNLIWVGVGIGFLYWFLESWIHVVIFKDGLLISHIFTPDPHELWKRFLVIALLVIFSIYAQRSIKIRRRSEKDLGLALEEMDQIFHTASVGMRVIDRDFNQLKINRTFEKIAHVSMQEVIGKKCYEVFAGPKCFTSGCPLTLILNGEKSVEYQVDKKRYNGTIVPCILTATPFKGTDGNLAGIVESFKDITELERAKEAIRTKRDKLQGILSHMKEGICIVNSDYEIEFQNITHKKFIGEKEGSACYVSFYGLDRPCEPCLMKEAIDFDKTRQLEFDTSDDENFELTYTPIIDIDGKKKAVVLLRDVTKEKKAVTALMQAEQMTALGELSAGIAHEINNPINGVINYAQILINKYRDHYLIKDIAERMIKEGNRVARIVEGLLSFSRYRNEEKIPILINDVLLDSLTLSASQLRKDNIILDTDIPTELPPVIAQANEIEQVFINLISNARYALNQKYPEANADKVLEIRAETVKISEKTFLHISFRDHGTGISTAIMDKVRKPFFSTKQESHGTGLGLSISHAIIDDHGGLLSIDSCENEFTNICVNLPIQNN